MLFRSRIQAAIGGPPCETWSVARHFGTGPVLLRDQQQLWGLIKAPLAATQQIEIGNLLLQTFLLVIAELLIVGGCGILEHPAFYDDHARLNAASIWLLPEVRTIVDFPDCEEVNLNQGDLGGISLKPTTLLSLRVPSLPTRIQQFTHYRRHELTKLGGKDHQGRFTTAAAKEYPAPFCKAMALALRDSIESRIAPGKFYFSDFDPLDVSGFTDLWAPLDPYLLTHVGNDFAPRLHQSVAL